MWRRALLFGCVVVATAGVTLLTAWVPLDGRATVYAGPLRTTAVVVAGGIVACAVSALAWAYRRRRKLAVAAAVSLLLGAASVGVWQRGKRGDSFGVNWCGTAEPPPRIDPAWRDPQADPPDEPVDGHAPDATVVGLNGTGEFVIDCGRADLLWPGVRFEVYDASLAGASALPRRGKTVAFVVRTVGAHSSVCAVYGASADWPVRLGDVVAAEAFQRGVRRWYFVAGTFDLNGDGKTETADTWAIQHAVTHPGGGRLVESVADADVVVLGREPRPYVAPARDADHPVHKSFAWITAAMIDDYRRTAATAKEKALPVVDQQWVSRALGYPEHAKYPPVPRRTLRIDSGDGRLRLLFRSGIDWRERRPSWMIHWERPPTPGPIPLRWPAVVAQGPEPPWRRAGFGFDYASVPTEAGAPNGYRLQGHETAWAVTAPYWAVTGLFAVLPLAWLARARRRVARRLRARRGCCEACGYDLRASREAGRCPECGQGIPG